MNSLLEYKAGGFEGSAAKVWRRADCDARNWEIFCIDILSKCANSATAPKASPGAISTFLSRPDANLQSSPHDGSCYNPSVTGCRTRHNPFNPPAAAGPTTTNIARRGSLSPLHTTFPSPAQRPTPLFFFSAGSPAGDQMAVPRDIPGFYYGAIPQSWFRP
jgi:hypothetical protein